MKTPTLEALKHNFLRLCDRYDENCIDANDGQCPLYGIGYGCEDRYLYDVLTGKRNINGTLREESGEAPANLPGWANEGAIVEHIYSGARYSIIHVESHKSSVVIREVGSNEIVRENTFNFTNLYKPCDGVTAKSALPKWCKEGRWVFYAGNLLGKIYRIDEGNLYIDLVKKGPTFGNIKNVKPVRFREYRTFEEAQDLRGAWVAWEDKTSAPPNRRESLVTSLSMFGGQVDIDGQSFEFWKSVDATINGVPIGVPEVDEAVEDTP